MESFKTQTFIYKIEYFDVFTKNNILYLVICIKNEYGADYAQPLGEKSFIPHLCIKVYWSKGLGILIYWLMVKCVIGKEM